MRGRRQKPITKEQCLKAMDATKSVKAAARYLGHSYDHIKQYFKNESIVEIKKGVIDSINISNIDFTKKTLHLSHHPNKCLKEKTKKS
jgi:hypothetical protein